MQEQNFRRMYEAQRLSPKFNVLFGNVESCVITYTRTADSPGGYYSDHKPLIKHVDVSRDSSMVTIECINPDCNKGYFNLRSIICEMVSHHVTNKSGEMFCDGMLEKDSGYQCRSKLKYDIQIKYK